MSPRVEFLHVVVGTDEDSTNNMKKMEVKLLQRELL